MKTGKIIVFSAPSGSGKTTIVHYLMSQIDNLHFSVSATSRAPRGNEINGKDYYFLTPDEFRANTGCSSSYSPFSKGWAMKISSPPMPGCPSLEK